MPKLQKKPNAEEVTKKVLAQMRKKEAIEKKEEKS